MNADPPIERVDDEPDDTSVATLPSLDYMRGYLAATPTRLGDPQVFKWLDLLMGEVELLRFRLGGRRVLAGDPRDLTPMETRVLRYLRDTRMRQTEIAETMHLSINTIKTHSKSIYRKLGLEGGRAELRGGS